MKKGDTYLHDFVIAPDIYKGFKELFRDHNPLHIDPAYARSKGYEDAVMYGNILGGFISYFIGECLPCKNVVLVSQEIKYKNPCYINDLLTLKVTVDDFFDSVNVAELKYIFLNNAKEIAKGKIQVKLI